MASDDGIVDVRGLNPSTDVENGRESDSRRKKGGMKSRHEFRVLVGPLISAPVT
jgi:hypothetical protein